MVMCLLLVRMLLLRLALRPVSASLVSSLFSPLLSFVALVAVSRSPVPTKCRNRAKKLKIFSKRSRTLNALKSKAISRLVSRSSRLIINTIFLLTWMSTSSLLRRGRLMMSSCVAPKSLWLVTTSQVCKTRPHPNSKTQPKNLSLLKAKAVFR